MKNFFQKIIPVILMGSLLYSCNPDMQEAMEAPEDLMGTGAFLGQSCGCPDPATRATVLVGNAAGGDFFITTSQTWTCDNTYIIRGKVRVKDGATLTIQPGTIVKGNSPADKVVDRAKAGFLIITTTGAIDAVGTSDCPIVFTSRKSRGNRARGDWGGLLLAGNGLITTSTGAASANLEGFLTGEEPVPYGGNGSVIAPQSRMSFCRIEFAGIDISGGGGNETNSLTMGGLQRDVYVQMDHIQATLGGDDSFEWFGGNVDMKYLYSFKGTDDDFDLDQGYKGRVQFGVALRSLTNADASGSNGFESDGIRNTSCLLPFGATTTAQFSNFTLIGANNTKVTPWPLLPTPQVAKFDHAVHIREGSNMMLRNSLIGAWEKGLRMSDQPTFDNFNVNNNMFRQNLWVHAIQLTNDGCGTLNTSAAQIARLTATKNGYIATGGRGGATTFLGLNAEATKMNMPKMIPIEFKTQVDYANFEAGFFTPTTYRGAWGLNDVNAGWFSDPEAGNPKWLEFTPESAEYGDN